MPNRIIKESICTSEDIEALTWFEEAFYYRLIVNCDDYGRMDARPAILRSRLFPLKGGLELADIEAALARLCAMGMVRCYVARGRTLLCLPAWGAHQRMRAKREKYPAPEGDFLEVGCDDMSQNDDGVERDDTAHEVDIRQQAAADGGGTRPESETETESQSDTESEAEAETEEDGAYARVAAAAVGIGMPYAKKDAEIARGLIARYGADWVVEAIARAALGSSRTWRYVQGILRRWAEKGGMDAVGAGKGDGAAAAVGKRVMAQMYTQREYDREELEALFEVR